jgi:dolichol-phosphate mannosyltransferase
LPLEYSIVIPLHNEEQNIGELFQELEEALATIHSYEIIFVDDASTDNSLQILKKIVQGRTNIKVISLKKRVGQSGALYCGFMNAKAPVIITLDADLQNPPQEIPKLIEKFNEGYDFVIGIRQERQDNFIKKISSYIANTWRRFILKDVFKDIGCSLRIFKREVLSCIFPFKSLHRFLPYLAFINGFKIAQIPVKHQKRRFGKSKYGVWKRWREGIIDLQAMHWFKKRIIPYKELFDERNLSTF